MKKSLYFAVLALIALVFMGCPYESKVPIAEPDTKVNPDYMGKWFPESESGTQYKVTKEDKFTYQVAEIQEKVEDNGEGEATEPTPPVVYTGHITLVNEIPFLNLFKKDTETYMLFKVAMNGKKVVLSEVTPYIKETFNSSAELKKFITDNMDKSYFFGDDQTYTLQ